MQTILSKEPRIVLDHDWFHDIVFFRLISFLSINLSHSTLLWIFVCIFFGLIFCYFAIPETYKVKKNTRWNLILIHSRLNGHIRLSEIHSWFLVSFMYSWNDAFSFNFAIKIISRTYCRGKNRQCEGSFRFVLMLPLLFSFIGCEGFNIFTNIVLKWQGIIWLRNVY